MPRGCPVPLAERYDVAMLDLDGVVYIGAEAVPAAVQALEKFRGVGARLAFVTNNASRTPETVAAHLQDLGIDAAPSDVVTSAQAAARIIAERLPPRSSVLVVGDVGLERAVTERGYRAVRTADDDPLGVVQGYSQRTDWRALAEATVAVRNGALWVAANLDATLPSARGPLPGNGSLVEVVRSVTGQHPLVAGKPEPALHLETVDRTGATNPIVVGDRLDTDIEGATRVGCDSLLVLTGLARPADLLLAGPAHRPSYVAEDLEGLLAAHPPVTATGSTVWACRDWRVTVPDPHGRALELDGAGDDLDALRALCAAAWDHWPEGAGARGQSGTPGSGVQVGTASEQAEHAAVRLGLR